MTTSCFVIADHRGSVQDAQPLLRLVATTSEAAHLRTWVLAGFFDWMPSFMDQLVAERQSTYARTCCGRDQASRDRRAGCVGETFAAHAREHLSTLRLYFPCSDAEQYLRQQVAVLAYWDGHGAQVREAVREMVDQFRAARLAEVGAVGGLS